MNKDIIISVKSFLSERMLQTASLVTKGNRVADIGCDHAYTSAYLVQSGISPFAIAMDVRKGPLARAEENLKRFSLTEKVQIRLSDGLEKLKPGEADTLLFAGMGGPLMISLLRACPETVEAAKELVLQPQSEVSLVRRFVHESGFRIAEEKMLIEEEKFYVVFRAEHGVDIPYNEQEYRYGRQLLTERPEEFLEYLRHEYAAEKEILENLATQDTKKAELRKSFLLERMKEISELLRESKG